ncbi:DNA glycosylase AlkZ-like family protein [Dactylosporangium sucinum]|uniref:DNA glycosylase AlkZ-like family protein n=1 Tax=Dactylosporangium sucinum TaxID=1424081 RepID=UPI00167D1B97
MIARDALAVRPLVAVVGERMWATNFGRRPGDPAIVPEIVAEGARILAAEPLTFAELGKRLAERWPDRDPAAMAQAVRVFETLVQVPPRGCGAAAGRPCTRRPRSGGSAARRSWSSRPCGRSPTTSSATSPPRASGCWPSCTRRPPARSASSLAVGRRCSPPRPRVVS